MERYYFHHYSSGKYVRDEEGSIHLRFDDALREGYESAREIMMSQIRMGRLDLRQKIEIVCDRGTLLATIAFSEAASESPGFLMPALSESRNNGASHGKNDRRKH